MRALIVFESMFGNAKSVAQAIAKGLSPFMTVEIVEVNAAPTVIAADINLLVVGGPTHQFGLTRPATRQEAAQETNQPLVSCGIGLREWLEVLERGRKTTAATAFATRISNPWFLKYLGSAARTVARGLRRRGFRILAPAESFFVTGGKGPLLEGELERAEAWGAALARKLVP